MNPVRQPWYIKVARRAGAKTDAQALQLCLVISLILLVIAGALYYGLFFSTKTAEPLDPALLQEMERRANQR